MLDISLVIAPFRNPVIQFRCPSARNFVEAVFASVPRPSRRLLTLFFTPQLYLSIESTQFFFEILHQPCPLGPVTINQPAEIFCGSVPRLVPQITRFELFEQNMYAVEIGTPEGLQRRVHYRPNRARRWNILRIALSDKRRGAWVDNTRDKWVQARDFIVAELMTVGNDVVCSALDRIQQVRQAESLTIDSRSIVHAVIGDNGKQSLPGKGTRLNGRPNSACQLRRVGAVPGVWLQVYLPSGRCGRSLR